MKAPSTHARYAFLCLGLLAAGSAAATTYRLTPADRSELELLTQQFFDAARDNNTTLLNTLLPTDTETAALFSRGSEIIMQRRSMALQRDLATLHTRFTGGTFVRISPDFTRSSSVSLNRCGRFGANNSQCASGPAFEWRNASGTVERFQIDTLVRINGHWKIFDPSF